MACNYKIGDQWYSEEEIQLIYRNARGEDVTEAWDKLQESKEVKTEQSIQAETKTITKETNLELADKKELFTKDTKINIYAGSNQNTELSNFAIRPFKYNLELDNGSKEFEFKSVEQGFHFIKAITAKNSNIASQILKTSNGAQLKRLTNRSNLKMTPEQIKEWDTLAKSIMLNLMYESFSQNPDKAKLLLDTGDATITHTQDNTRWKTDFPEVVMTVRDMLQENVTETSTQTDVEITAEESREEAIKRATKEWESDLDEQGFPKRSLQTIIENINKEYDALDKEKQSVEQKSTLYQNIPKELPNIELPKINKEVVKPAQILIPFKFQDSNGNKLKLKDFTKTDGTLDFNKIDPKLLEIFSMRIPNQGPNSQSYVEIVGFLPETMGDLVVATQDYLTQMGSDFDVDALYSYFSSAKYEDGRLTLSDEKNEKIKNEIVDIHKAIHSNPSTEVQGQIKRPIGFWKLDKMAESIDGLASSDILTPLSDDYQTSKFKAGTSGKAGTGVFSNVSTFLAVIQDLGLIYKTKTSEGLKPWSLTIGNETSKGSLGNKLAADNKTYISEIIEGYQSASVDNANENILDKLNITNSTFKFIQAGHLLGFTDSIPMILVQDIITDYLEELESLNGLGKMSANAEEEAFIAIKQKYATNVSNKDLITNTNLLNRANSLTPNLLYNTKKYGKESPDYYLTQLSTLAVFKELNKLGKELANIQSLINTDSSLLGKNLFETTSKEDRLNKMLGTSSIENIERVLDGTINGFATNYGLKFNNKLWSKITPYGQQGLTNFFTQLETIFNKEDAGAGSIASFRAMMWDALKSYMYTNPELGLYSENIDTERKRVFFEKPSEGKQSLAGYVKMLKKAAPQNAFLKALSTVIEPNGNTPSLIVNNSAYDVVKNQDLIFSSFTNLMISDVKLPDFNGEPYSSRKLIEDLVMASMISGGVQNATNYVKLIPPAYLYSLTKPGSQETFIEKLSKITKNKLFNDENYIDLGQSSSGIIPKVIEQIVQHNANILPQVSPTEVYSIGSGSYKASMAKPYFAVKGTGKNYTIYKKVGESNEEYSIYMILDSKGTLNYNEYIFDKTSLSNIASNIPTGFNSNNNVESPFKRDNNSIPLANPDYKKVIPADELQLKTGTNKDLANTLSIIKESNDVSFQTELAGFYYNKVLSDPNIKLEVRELSTVEGAPIKGVYKGNTIYVNNNEAYHTDKSDLIDTVLHEITHHFVNKNYNNPLNDTQRQAKQRISDLYNQFVKLNINDSVLNNARKSETEFIAEIMSNGKVQSALDRLVYSGNKSIFDRFKELIQSLLGIGNTNTTLKLAVNDILTFMEEIDSADTSNENIEGSQETGYDADLSGDVRPFSLDTLFPSKQDVFTKYSINDNGIAKGQTYPDALKTARKINTEQGVYKATVTKAYRTVKGARKEMSIVVLERRSEMKDSTYAYNQLSPQMKKQLQLNTCK